jgi:gliding motility-associated-like protein
MNATSNNPFNITFSGTGPNNNSFEFESPVLTLNGDGINDRLIIKNFEGYGKCSISVYNSRGVLIYSNKDYKNDWDLTINGRLLETGGYFYIAETDSGIYRGSFSILRPF